MWVCVLHILTYSTVVRAYQDYGDVQDIQIDHHRAKHSYIHALDT